MAAPAPVGGGGRVSIATTADYAEAQRIVDRLSDEGFPVEHTAIVGSELRLVEQVTGRLTVARPMRRCPAPPPAPRSGCSSGCCSVCSPSSTPSRRRSRLDCGVCCSVRCSGRSSGAVGHAATRGRRDFSSVSGLAPTRYEVLVDATHAERAQGIVGVRDVT